MKKTNLKKKENKFRTSGAGPVDYHIAHITGLLRCKDGNNKKMFYQKK